MLRCGANWRPVRVERVIETLSTNCLPAKVFTDDGIGFLKGIGNPAGTEALAMELVGSELAAWFGLTVPDFVILNVRDIAIPLKDRGFVEPGPAFISREQPGMTSDGGGVLLGKLHRPQDVARLVVFDTWIRNADRYPPEGALLPVPSNRDNLFFSPNGRHFDLVVFDHSLCFVETTLEDEIGGAHIVEDERIYGLFPEFIPYITKDAVIEAVTRLRQIDRAVVEEIVGSVPREWGVTARVRAVWVEVILERARTAARTALRSLLDQAELDV